MKRNNSVKRDNSVRRDNSLKRDNPVKRDNLLVAGQQISMIIHSMALQAFQNFSEQILAASNHNVHYSDPPVMVCFKLQALVYHILPSTTAVFSYAIGSRKLSANEQVFWWCSNSSKFVTNNSDKTRRVIYSRQQSLHQHK